ncbi:serine/arginine-rich splicing factor 4-like protein [Leptotrombidium deliense]|uniref:Serine/arginine-rich splicing factor 4-like protein n=1 Tax=Leptotrombidium deliense TaxID=299467 RepID=A0A443SQ02_9ACAR|nr:serine/arginine-rich splicing factor 4-like protein [Leptotrombidium deliense]
MGTRIYVGRLPYDVRERDIEKFFKGYGRIREILMKDGFAFVEFDDHRDADDAVYELNGKELMGERVSVELARRSTKRPFYGRALSRGGGQRRPRNPNWIDKVHVEYARGPSRGRGRFRPYGSSRGYYASSRSDRPSGGLTYAEK